MGGEFAGATELRNGVLTGSRLDTRTLAPGDLFFAIRGARHDGHAFVRTLSGRGPPARWSPAGSRTCRPPPTRRT